MSIAGHRILAEVERYTRAAEQERLTSQAIKRKTESRSGKPSLDEVANQENDADIASIVSRMALPRGGKFHSAKHAS
jgi:hypothetical protein